MARSTYIYLLYCKPEDEDPAAAFTVKHEAVTYWKEDLDSIETAFLVRIPDNGPFSNYTIVEGWKE